MDFLLTVCMAAIASALFRILVPENKFTKQISLLIACVFLLTAATAISGAEFGSLTEAPEISASSDYIGFSGEVNKSLQKKICSDMSDKLYAILHKNEIYPEQIHIGVNISGLYSISITQVKLVLSENSRDKADKALALLRAELSEDIEIKTEFKEVR
ncbi:MAG: hypothetical protein E7485_02745 [Ruminococcaceae bacterium]|nr:hypothetical protein [Oscillospiraceae bacterium]